jgi:multidrug efflux pump subunit AcrA (membrane-fusion protein)
MNRVTIGVGVAALVLLGSLSFTQEAPEKRVKQQPAASGTASKGETPKVAAAPAKPATHKVAKKPFKIEVKVEGSLGAEEAAPISYRPHLTVQAPPSQGPLTIRKVVEHGTRVKKGDLLVAFDTRKLDEVLADLESEKKLLDVNLKLAEEELPLFLKSAPVELAAAETAKQRSDESLKYFVEVGRPESEKRANYGLKTAKFMLETELEELRQLQKMYKANDLTEDTEKIILRRQEFYVEAAQFYYQYAQVQHAYTMKFTLPHQHKDLVEAQIKNDLQLEKLRATQDSTARQKQLTLNKMRFEVDKNNKRLERLQADRTALTIVAPVDGIVYHGKFSKGNWSASSILEARLVEGGTVLPDEVFLTVVNPRPDLVTLTVAEKEMHWLKPGMAGKARVPFRPDRKLTARVTRLAPLPVSPGKFEVQVALDLGPEDASLMPGMACTIQWVPYHKTSAIAIPTSYIHDEEDRSIVYVLAASGKHNKREVKLGAVSGDNTEILAGLHEGDEILLERPQPDAKSAKTPGKGEQQ